LIWNQTDFNSYVLQEFVTNQSIFVDEISTLNSYIRNAHRAGVKKDIYFGKESLFADTYLWNVQTMDEDRNGRINRRFQSFIHSGIFNWLQYGVQPILVLEDFNVNLD
jgi:hypothetical protein